jgi:hypothetical protein
VRAQGFIGENDTALSNAVDLTASRRRLDDLVTNFTTHALVQDTNDRDTKGESALQRQLRVTLSTDVMRPIAEIGRRNLRTTPEFEALRLPRANISGLAFLASAKGMADAAAIHKETLIERGLSANFLDQFQSALTKLEASVKEREKSRTRRMGATKALAFEEQEGRSVLKVLDAQVRQALRGNPALLGAWEGARAIHRRPGVGSTKPATSGETAKPTTTTTSIKEATPPASAA